MRTLVVLPTYNEADNILDVLRLLRAAVPEAEILVVDDNSPDGTAAVVEAATDVGPVKVLRRPGKLGLGTAYRDGFGVGLAEGVDVLVEMDSDLSHDPAALPSLLAGIEAGADLVIGSRYVPGGSMPKWSWHRRLLSEGGNRYASAVLGLGVHDSTSGFRAYRATILRAIDLAAIRADGYGFQIEMAYQVRRAGGTIAEVPIRFTNRLRGLSKMSGRIVVEALLLVTWWSLRDGAWHRRLWRSSR